MDNIVGILFHGHRCNALICQSEKSKKEKVSSSADPVFFPKSLRTLALHKPLIKFII